MLPFHTSAPVVDGYVRNPDGSIDQAGTRSLAKALKWHPGDGMSPAEARAMGDPMATQDKGGGKSGGKG